MFQFVTGDGPVSSLHEWSLENSEDCMTCFRFPLHRLQEKDNDLGLLFYAKLFVYNNAGHFLEVLSGGFQLPSRYPPGHAILYDLDPANHNIDMVQDVDSHFTSNVLCVLWRGFKHQESISLQIGVGQDRHQDDIVNFYSTQNTEIKCINSSLLLTGRTYFVLLRAKCSGGETFASSNGVKILNASQVIDSFKIELGEPQDTIERITKMQTVDIGSIQNVTFDLPLKVGRKYCLGLVDNANEIIILNNTDIKSNGAHIEFKSSEMFGNLVLVLPFTENPKLSFSITQPNISSLALSLFNCPTDTDFISMVEDIAISWYFTRYIQGAFSCEIRLLRVNDETNTSKIFKYPLRLVGTSNFTKTVIFQNSFSGGDVFQAEAKIYTNNQLIGEVRSKNITVLNGTFDGQVGNASVEYNDANKCLEIQAIWKSFQNDRLMISHYLWAISKDDSGTSILTNWSLVFENGNLTYRVNRCLSVPFYAGTSMFLCVRGYSLAGSFALSCSKINHPNVGSFPAEVVYDLDTTADVWNDIQQLIHSHWIGEKISIVHDNELNFGKAEILVGAAVMYATERNLTWYLMKSPAIPSSCTHDDTCLVEITTDTGFVVFPREKTILNQHLYVCIHADDKTVHREFFNETFKEIESCSNGFILDSRPPTKGRITVKNHNNYITSRNIEISWAGFTDNVNAVGFGYPSNLSYYTVAIGSMPGSDDVVPFRNTSNMFMDAVLTVDDGSTVYISVTAFDHTRQNTCAIKAFNLDTSPPINGHLLLGNSILDQLHITSYTVDLYLTDFKDFHSSIDYFKIGVGLTELIDDVVPMQVYPTDDATLILPRDRIIEGHIYFVLVTATNRAGLTSEISSIPFIIDTTPPSPGHVLDGSPDVKDVDFQSDIKVIYGHWAGFIDQHSGIDYYMVCLGTRPYMDDVKSFLNVGLRQDISWKGPYTTGQKYFITVSACNPAGLCSQASSDGIILDNSPPVAGLVRVGSSSRHERYQPHNTTIRIHWEGFEDPHSGIERFEACVGKMRFSCDVVPIFSCLLQSNIIKTGINVPLRTAMYATVVAYNNVGLKILQTSDIFFVDDTPPNIIIKPTFSLDYNAYAGKQIQWERSVLRIFWEFKDEDSPILRHELSLLTHYEGHTPIEHMHLGNVNNITITLDAENWLHNGDTYSVVITSCNAAGQCTSAYTPDLMIDSTPPFLGGFKPPMTWKNCVSSYGELQSQLMLTWYGFADGESEIETYFITVGKTYTGHELTGDIISVVSKHSLSEMSANITINTSLNADDHLILSIWAQNKAGLNSTIGRLSVNTLLTDKYDNTSSESGILEIQKHSCDVHFCNKDCTCAVLGQPCTDSENVKPCQTPARDHSTTLTEFTDINVSGGLLNFDQNITASSACLSGHWDLVQGITTREIVRYEWSAGLLGQPLGEGIFDLKSEIPWHDVGLHTSIVYCLPTNHSLLHAEEYIIYVRAWFDFDLFREFHSYPIVVYHSGPSIRRGRFVMDSDASCTKDYDFINWTDTITACWDGVFNDQHGNIIYFSVSLGTSPKSDDVFPTTNVGSSTNYSHNQANLSHGTRYFFTVSAHNNIGLYTSVVSDGFTIDIDNPTPGVVFNTLDHTNELYQSSNEKFTVSWHGFVDHFSGIQSYFVGLVESDVDDLSNIAFLNIGLKTKHTFSNRSITSGTSYVGVIKAIDAAGHSSIYVRSPSKRVDTTPPSGVVCTKYEKVEEVDNRYMSRDRVQKLSLSVNLTKDALYVITSDVRGNDTQLKATLSIDTFKPSRLPVTTNHDGLLQMKYSFFSPLSGTQDITIMLESNSLLNATASISRCTYAIPDSSRTLHVQQIGPNIIAVNVISQDRESGIRKVDIGAGTTYEGFQFQPLTTIHGGSSGILYINATHGSPVHVFAIVENYADLKAVFHSPPITMDHTRPNIENVTATQHLTNDLTFIHTTWVVRDLESGVKACYCGLGESRFASDVMEHWKADTLTSCTSPELKLANGREVYITIKCVNNVELVYEVCFEPVVIVKHPPLTDQVKLTFMNLNSESNDDIVTLSETAYIQTNDSHIQMQWSGFLDISSIEEYKYRLLQDNLLIIDWTSSGRKTMATIARYPLNSGSTYTAEVKALNAIQWSSVIRSSLLIYKTQPKLTGAAVSLTESERKLTIDWARVFDQNLPPGLSTVYSVVIGTRPEFNDIYNIRTQASSLYIIVPMSTIVSPEVKEIFITITCHFNTGMHTKYQTNFKF